MLSKNKNSSIKIAKILVTILFSIFFFTTQAHAEIPSIGTNKTLTSEATLKESLNHKLTSHVSQKGTTTGVELGSGFIGTKKMEIDQKSVKSQSLSRLIYWRRDALNDTSIKILGQTIKEYLKKNGITENQYLNPSWSNSLERIALQRAIEAGDSTLGHTRPTGENFSSATYEGVSSNTEILAWSNSTSFNGTNAVDMWATEKAEYVKEVNGQSHTETGHYKTLIDPSYKSYGFAITNGFNYTKVAVGESSTLSFVNTSSTNLSGTFDFDISISNALFRSSGLVWNLYSGLKTLNLGDSFTLKCWLGYRDGTFALKDAWHSSNTKILSVDSNSKITAIGSGNASIYLEGQNNTDFTVTFTVPSKTAMFRLYNPYTGEHFYTSSSTELNSLVKVGWKSENIGWYGPKTSSIPVYRLYNKYAGDHHYTTNASERDYLVKAGWNSEGTGWYSATKGETNASPLLRQYNPYATSGAHNFTLDSNERNNLVKLGWKDEGEAWWGFNSD